jgi:dihydroorotate dehydrogenase electron transfer subunit
MTENVILSPRRTMHETFTVTEVRRENVRTQILIFDHELPSQPGQFVMAWLPGVDEKPFSIAAADPLTLLVVAVGPMSEAMHRLEAGDRLWVRGPLGQGFRLPDAPGDKRVLLAGGGYGVAPLRFLADRARRAGCAVDVCIGAGAVGDVLWVEAFERLGASVVITTEDGSLGTAGLVTDATEAVIRARTPDAVYACGPVPMLEAVERQCLRHDLPHQLSWEAHMRCGIGLCGSCELEGRDGWLACGDGPVSFG